MAFYSWFLQVSIQRNPTLHFGYGLLGLFKKYKTISPSLLFSLVICWGNCIICPINISHQILMVSFNMLLYPSISCKLVVRCRELIRFRYNFFSWKYLIGCALHLLLSQIRKMSCPVFSLLVVRLISGFLDGLIHPLWSCPSVFHLMIFAAIYDYCLDPPFHWGYKMGIFRF